MCFVDDISTNVCYDLYDFPNVMSSNLIEKKDIYNIMLLPIICDNCIQRQLIIQTLDMHLELAC